MNIHTIKLTSRAVSVRLDALPQCRESVHLPVLSEKVYPRVTRGEPSSLFARHFLDGQRIQHPMERREA